MIKKNKLTINFNSITICACYRKILASILKSLKSLKRDFYTETL